ncbi:MAG: 2-hydroxyglutaryl-CoA dehydratase [Candidatus Nealsonbacteria bacterium]|nr:2-hydroxyglutaryl-CoA dehydratase [Candidatus Nealsonbacteria bacterium]
MTNICAGIDAGSRTLKVVLLDADRMQPVAFEVVDQGIQQNALASQVLGRLLVSNGIARGDVRSIVATGYGRKLIEAADDAVTEITCQACGVHHQLPETRTIVDIGGQDSKLVRLGPSGVVEDFAMNDRCAAGTGRFLEVLATRLSVELADLGRLVDESRMPAIISSMCVVFAETEIVGLLASGTSPADIVAGVQASIAIRLAAMAGRHLREPVVFTGGVALVPGMDAALQSALESPVAVAPDPQITGALGAAVLAARRLNGQAAPSSS